MLLAASLVQSTWLAHWSLLGARVDLPLVLAVAVALVGGVERGAVLGFCAGLMAGYAAAFHTGSFAVSHAVAAGLFGLFPRRFSTDNPLAPPVCAFVATLLATLVFFVMSPTAFPVAWWVRHGLASGVQNALLMWPVFYLVVRYCLPANRPLFA